MNSPQKINQIKEAIQKKWYGARKNLFKAGPTRSLERTKRTLENTPRYQPGNILFLNWSIDYVDAPALASSVDLLLIKKINDFNSSNSSPVILDCGANIGISVLNYKRRYPNSKILAFEPDPNIIPVLKNNLKNNGAEDVKLVEAAVWTSKGKLNFFCEGADGSKLVPEENKCTSKVEVNTIDLDDYISGPIDLVKMDIEGAEFEVIPHIRSKLHFIKNILIECHIITNEIEKFSKLLEELGKAGFQVSISVLGPWNDLLNKPVRIKNGFDQYILVSAWRE